MRARMPIRASRLAAAHHLTPKPPSLREGGFSRPLRFQLRLTFCPPNFFGGWRCADFSQHIATPFTPFAPRPYVIVKAYASYARRGEVVLINLQKNRKHFCEKCQKINGKYFLFGEDLQIFILCDIIILS